MEDVRICPQCGEINSAIKDTRYRKRYDNLLSRKRECIECGYSYDTVEILVSDLGVNENKVTKEQLSILKVAMENLLKEVYGNV